MLNSKVNETENFAYCNPTLKHTHTRKEFFIRYTFYLREHVLKKFINKKLMKTDSFTSVAISYLVKAKSAYA